MDHQRRNKKKVDPDPIVPATSSWDRDDATSSPNAPTPAPGAHSHVLPVHPPSDKLATVEGLLAHFGELETQLAQVRESLTHSHRLATLGTIATIIAHEYNNILTPVVSYAQLSLANPADGELMLKAVRSALIGAEKAASISSSLLGFAREADSRHVAQLPATIDDAIKCMARRPEKDGIELTVNVPPLTVAMSPLNLEQVLVNLLLNAKTAMQADRRRDRRITITAKAKANLVHLDITDTGPGIPEGIRDRVFEPFVTQRPTMSDASSKDSSARGEGEQDKPDRGTGLGLCICRDLIRQAGGDIAFTTATGQGTTFHITLPRAQDIFAVPAD